MANIYETHLDSNAANYAALSPLTFLARARDIYPDRTAVIYGDRRYSWSEHYDRCAQVADALRRRGVGAGDTVAILAGNIPEMLEAHFAVPMTGAVLNAINVRLDAPTVRFILEHGEAAVFLVDEEFGALASEALDGLDTRPMVIGIEDASLDAGRLLGEATWNELIAEGSSKAVWAMPDDEWAAITLNYTSGTTGNPKGVVYHHRGAYLNAVSNALTWNMGDHPTYLWTLPMFHCNGWCFPWTLAVNAGTSVCLRQVRADQIFEAIAAHGVSHFCGAPVVLNTLLTADDDLKAKAAHPVSVMTAGAAPPAAVIEGMEAMGFSVTHVYGLTETYGPVTLCAWQGDRWDALPPAERAGLKARQGVRGHMLEGLMVADPETLEPVPMDGATMGEVMMRGNNVMKGYLKNPDATVGSFDGGWFHSGDLAVWHPDGYIQIKDRSKDIIISGGENISSIEIEDTLYRHPSVLAAAVVAKSDAKWGETPCAFVELKPGAVASADGIIDFCRENMARFKAPKHVVFGELPKTSTGKVQKFVLRERAEQI
ncbi:MAG: AMP-binding protein [Pseudomonadales bacterium]|nr:acyl-CoA synthetase [Pseudomonadales bacterium]NIX08204.1 AMP-binding protein [Pseudomonadales bacterium]